MPELSRTRDTESHTRDTEGAGDVRWLIKPDVFKKRMRRPGAVRGTVAQAREVRIARSTLNRVVGREVEPSLGVAMCVAALADLPVEKLFEPVWVKR